MWESSSVREGELPQDCTASTPGDRPRPSDPQEILTRIVSKTHVPRGKCLETLHPWRLHHGKCFQCCAELAISSWIRAPLVASNRNPRRRLWPKGATLLQGAKGTHSRNESHARNAAGPQGWAGTRDSNRFRNRSPNPALMSIPKPIYMARARETLRSPQLDHVPALV